MAAEDAQRTKKKSSKKARKDKSGQPIVSEDSISQSKQEESVAEEEKQEVDAVEENKTNEDSGNFVPNKVVISGMPYSATNNEIRDFFKDVGYVLQLKLSTFPDTGNFNGLAFVTFQTEDEAKDALKLDGEKMGDRVVKIERCRGPPEKRKREFPTKPEKAGGCYCAYIGNLAKEVTEDDIRNFFKKSKIKGIRFAMNKKTGKFRGFGHVDFEDVESVEAAVKKNQVEFHGKPIKVAYAAGNLN